MRAIRRPQLLSALAIGIAAVVGVAIVAVTAGRLVAFELWPAAPSPRPQRLLLVAPAATASERTAGAAAGRPDDVTQAALPAGAGADAAAGARVALDGTPPSGLPIAPAPPPPPPPPPAAAADATPAATAQAPLAPVGDVAGNTAGAVAQTLRSTAADVGRTTAPLDPTLAETVDETGAAVSDGVSDAGRALGDLLGGTPG